MLKVLTPLRKFLRYSRILGLHRTVNKSVARMRIRFPRFRLLRPKSPRVGVIGSGQFAFSTIAYFLEPFVRIETCYDISDDNASSFSRHYGARSCATIDDLCESDVDVVYVASNHATHTPYALKAMRHGLKKVYIEKPIAVSRQQLSQLEQCRRETGATLFAGYNRPFSPAIVEIVQQIRQQPASPLTINCFVSGHQLGPDHWYRNPKEGTRICGNLGHWIDLTIHLLAAVRRVPDEFSITVAYSNEDEPDDNLTVCMSTKENDHIVLTLTSRSEPFEGINESLNIHYGELIAKIDDFRSLHIWIGSKLIRRRYFPKDVGHRNSVLQPIRKPVRDWNEVVASTKLMLHIADMVNTCCKHSTARKISFHDDTE